MIVVVIVTFNSEKVIEDCLRSLPKFVFLKIIVVDSASKDQTVKLVKKIVPNAVIVQSKKNLGYAKGNNLGIEKALEMEAEQVLILNPDTILHKDCIKKLLMHVETHVQTQILGPKIYQLKVRKESTFYKVGKEEVKEKLLWSVGGILDKKRWTARLEGFNEIDHGQFNESSEVDFVSGTCMLIPKKALDDGLRFNENYFLYYEDVEFCLRAKRLGYSSIVVPEAELTHLEMSNQNLLDKDHNAPSSPFILRGGNNLKNYYLARNHLLFVERNAPLRVQLRELIRLPKTIIEHWLKKDTFALQGIKDYFFRKVSSP